MARPKKQTVEYFPHYVNSGKTMFILESNFGNDGYAFWFKILELLGMTEGHVYNCRNTADWEFLLAKTHVSEAIAYKILQKLADLDAIDAELWKNKLIWSDNFVRNLLPVYSNRKSDVPKKPVINSINDSTDELLPLETPRKEITTDKNTQSKVKESKVKESKGESRKTSSSNSDSKNVYRCFEECGFGTLNKMLIEMIDADIEIYTCDWVIEAMKEAIRQGKYKYSYVEGILRHWKTDGKEKKHGATKQDTFKPEDEGQGITI